MSLSISLSNPILLSEVSAFFVQNLSLKIVQFYFQNYYPNTCNVVL